VRPEGTVLARRPAPDKAFVIEEWTDSREYGVNALSPYVFHWSPHCYHVYPMPSYVFSEPDWAKDYRVEKVLAQEEGPERIVTVTARALTKTTWVVLLVVWPLLWLIARCIRRADRRSALRQFLQFAIIFLLAVYVINAVYGFRGALARLGDYDFVSAALCGPERSTPATSGTEPEESAGNRFRGTWLAGCRIPLPEDFILGIDRQKLDFESHFPSYLRGQWRSGGWW
jgi:hypothetical protein